jgi:hypothetical protein
MEAMKCLYKSRKHNIINNTDKSIGFEMVWFRNKNNKFIYQNGAIFLQILSKSI